MKPRDGIHTPIWADHRDLPKFSPAIATDAADVIVIGAGISGVTTAYVLAKQGKKVLVLDEGPIGSGQTHRTSAHLGSYIDDGFVEIEKQHGEESSRLAHESHSAAIDFIERVSREESIDAEFERVDAYLFVGPGDDPKDLENEFHASKRAGFKDMGWSEGAGDGARTGRCIRFGNQAIFHPVKYLVGLVKAAEAAGAIFRTGQRVIDATGRLDDAPPTVTFDDQTKITASAIVVATNTPTPINDWVSIYLKQASYRTYVAGFAIDEFSVANALYWDTHDPYHYVRLEKQGDQTILLVGGEDHKAGQDGASDERFEALGAWAKSIFPSIGAEVYRWSGQVQESSDGLGVIGVAPTKGENVYVITGDSGMGLTHGTLGALLIADLMAGKENPWATIYNPNRFMMNREAIKEDANANAQYLDYVTAGDIKSPDDLQPGQGGLMRSGLSKHAIYKDDNGVVTECSAVCPHLMAIVQWNPVEKTWDCPAHGSHFNCKGKLLIGPSTDDLAPIAN